MRSDKQFATLAAQAALQGFELTVERPGRYVLRKALASDASVLPYRLVLADLESVERWLARLSAPGEAVAEES